eukprot:gene10844-12054_t
MGYTGDDCLQRICPSGYDPVRPVAIEGNSHRRAVRLRTSALTGSLQGSLEVTIAGASALLNANAAALTSASCTYLLSGLRSIAEVECTRESYDSLLNTGSYLIRLLRYPTRTHMNNILYHNGNPSIDLFACNTSKVNEFEASGVGCDFEDVETTDLPLYGECSFHGQCNRITGNCNCERGFRGPACDDTRDDEDIDTVKHDGPFFTGTLQRLSLQREEDSTFNLWQVELNRQPVTTLRGDRLLTHRGPLELLRGGLRLGGESTNVKEGTTNTTALWTTTANVISILSPGGDSTLSGSSKALAAVEKKYHFYARSSAASSPTFSVDEDGHLTTRGSLRADNGSFCVAQGAVSMLAATVKDKLTVHGALHTSSGLTVGPDNVLHAAKAKGRVEITPESIRIHASGDDSISEALLALSSSTEKKKLLTGTVEGRKVLDIDGAGEMTVAGLKLLTGGIEVMAGGVQIEAGGLTVKGGLTVASGSLNMTSSHFHAAGLEASIPESSLIQAGVAVSLHNRSYVGNLIDLSVPASMSFPDTYNHISISEERKGIEDRNPIFRLTGSGTIHSRGGGYFDGPLSANGGLSVEKGIAFPPHELEAVLDSASQVYKVTVPLDSIYVVIPALPASSDEILLEFAPGSKKGRLLFIHNAHSNNTRGGVNLPPESLLLLVYEGPGQWTDLQAMQNRAQELLSIKKLTAMNDLDIGNYSLAAEKFVSRSLTPGHIVYVDRHRRLSCDSDRLTYVKGVLTAPALKTLRLAGSLDAKGHEISHAILSEAKIGAISVTTSSLTFSTPAALRSSSSPSSTNFEGGVAYVNRQGVLQVSNALQMIDLGDGKVDVTLTNLYSDLFLHGHKLHDGVFYGGDLKAVKQAEIDHLHLSVSEGEVQKQGTLLQALKEDFRQTVNAGENVNSDVSVAADLPIYQPLPPHAPVPRERHNEIKRSFPLLFMHPLTGEVVSPSAQDFSLQTLLYTSSIDGDAKNFSTVFHRQVFHAREAAIGHLAGPLDAHGETISNAFLQGGRLSDIDSLEVRRLRMLSDSTTTTRGAHPAKLLAVSDAGDGSAGGNVEVVSVEAVWESILSSLPKVESARRGSSVDMRGITLSNISIDLSTSKTSLLTGADYPVVDLYTRGLRLVELLRPEQHNLGKSQLGLVAFDGRTGELSALPGSGVDLAAQKISFQDFHLTASSLTTSNLYLTSVSKHHDDYQPLLGLATSGKVDVAEAGHVGRLRVKERLVLDFASSHQGGEGGLLGVSPQGDVVLLGGSQAGDVTNGLVVAVQSLRAQQLQATDRLVSSAVQAENLYLMPSTSSASSSSARGNVLIRDRNSGEVSVGEHSVFLDVQTDTLHLAHLAPHTASSRIIIDQASLHQPELHKAVLKESMSITTDTLLVQGMSEVKGDSIFGGSITVRGSVVGSGPYVDSSDRRLKTDIKPLHGALDLLSHLQAVTYRMKESNSTINKEGSGEEVSIGWIAQDVQNVLPQLVAPLPASVLPIPSDEKGSAYLGVQYSRACVVVAEAVKELHVQHEEEMRQVRRELDEERSRREALERRMDELTRTLQDLLSKQPR